MTGPGPAGRPGGDHGARLARTPYRKRGLQQYRTIFRVSMYWCAATAFLALAGSVLHFMEVRESCADILGVDGAATSRVAVKPPGVVVVCDTTTNPIRTVEIPMLTTALVIAWSALGILASVAFLFGYRHVRRQIESGRIEL